MSLVPTTNLDVERGRKRSGVRRIGRWRHARGRRQRRRLVRGVDVAEPHPQCARRGEELLRLGGRVELGEKLVQRGRVVLSGQLKAAGWTC